MTKKQKTFEVLSKLLTEDINRQLNTEERNKEFQSFLHFMNSDVYPVIDESSYENKTNLLLQFKSAIQEIEFLIRMPQLQNKTIVIVEGKKHAIPQWFEQHGMSKYAEIVRQNANLPMVLTSAENTKIIAQNSLENLAELTYGEFCHANQYLYKEQIDLNQFVQAFYIEAPCPYDQIAFIYLPQFMSRQSEMYKMLHSLAEVAFMINPIQKQLSYYKKPLFARCTWLIGDSIQEGMPILVQNEVEVLLNKLNEPCLLPKLDDIFIHAYESYLLSITEELEYESYLVNGLSKDLLKVNDDQLEANILFIRDNMKVQLQDKQKSHENLMKLFQQCITKLKKINHMLECVPDGNIRISNKRQIFIAKQAILALKLDNKSYYQELLLYFKNNQNIYYPLLKAYANKNPEELVQYIQQFEKLPLNDVIALIMLENFNFIQDIELYNMLKKYYQYNSEPTINMALGKAALVILNETDAQFYFKRAMNQGSFEAARQLLSFVDSENIIELENIARLLVPEACYLVSQYYLNSKFSKALTFLKIAATFEYLPALKLLSEIEFNRFKKRNRELSEERLQIMFSNALNLNHYVYEKEPSDQVAERLGKLYYWDYNHRKAVKYLAQVNNAECNFLCGKMYQYGDVLSQDLTKAKKYFEKAAEQDHPYAEIEIDKVTGWIKSNETRQSYSSTRSYTSTSSYSTTTSESSWCFLTTATCVALGKEDNCEEILNYQKYRDKHLRFDDDGRDLIVEYYRIAPIIVEKIEAEEKAKQVYIQLYEQYIKVGYKYLQNKDLVNAKATYIDMVKMLCNKYDIIPFEL